MKNNLEIDNDELLSLINHHAIKVKVCVDRYVKESVGLYFTDKVYSEELESCLLRLKELIYMHKKPRILQEIKTEEWVLGTSSKDSNKYVETLNKINELRLML